jgi:hypothetical protein
MILLHSKTAKANQGPLSPKQLSWHIMEKENMGIGASPGFTCPSYLERYNRNEFHPHVKDDWPHPFLHVLAVDGWGRLQLIVTVCLRVSIVTKYNGRRVWMFVVGGTLFQLTASSFN